VNRAPSTLDPAGPPAADIALLWWWMLGVAMVVFVVVVVYLLIATLRTAPANARGMLRAPGTTFVALWGIAVPAVVLTGLMVANIVVSGRAYAPPTDPDVTVEVIGHKFWWEVRYPDHDILTANEITIPVGEPVGLRLAASDVIHSFWVPRLHGKIDMIPGREHTFWIQADEPGTYRGICAEYCGLQHARMHFVVVAVPRGDFDAFVAERQDDPPQPEPGAATDGREVFVTANCAACHTVGGVSPYTDAGPALTDLATRRTIAAGMQDNTRENLREWIVDPQRSKRGARMPATALPDDELEALLDYLETLRPGGIAGVAAGGP
jgi:cytochrome c oxidase subunit II